MARLADAERRGWLIEHNHLTAKGDGAGHRNRLPLSARQSFDDLIDVLDRTDSKRRDLRLGIAAHSLLVEHAQPPPKKVLPDTLPAQEEVRRDI